MKEKLSVTIDPEVLEALQKAAGKEERNISNLVNKILRKALRDYLVGGK